MEKRTQKNSVNNNAHNAVDRAITSGSEADQNTAKRGGVAVQIRAVGPVYRGKGSLPGWFVGLATAAGNPVATVYRVLGTLKARRLALTLAKSHRIPLNVERFAG